MEQTPRTRGVGGLVLGLALASLVVLEQDSATLSGHYSSEALGEADVTGTVDGSDFVFSFESGAQGQVNRSRRAW